MIGLTHEEIKKVLAEGEYQNSNLLYDMMVENYDGYLFSKRSKERVFNATLVMYFLKSLERFDSPPENLVDSNIVTNYGKIDNILKLQNNDYYKEIIEETLKTKEITGTLKDQFNLLEDFSKDDIISLLYYFGYLTIKEEGFSNTIFRVPNKIMELTYGNYFLKMLRDVDINIDDIKLEESVKELVLTGKITSITEYVSEILNKASNRLFIKFDEKYIQLVYFILLGSLKQFNVKTEHECPNGYVDLFLEGNSEHTEYNIMIELKYIKKGEKNMKKVLEKRRSEGIEQLGSYQVEKDNLKKYLVIFIGDKVEEITEI